MNEFTLSLNEEKKEISFESVVYTGAFLCCDQSGFISVTTNDDEDDNGDQRWFSFKTKVCRSNIKIDLTMVFSVIFKKNSHSLYSLTTFSTYQNAIRDGNILRFVDADSEKVLSVNHQTNFIEIIEPVKKKKELQAGESDDTFIAYIF